MNTVWRGFGSAIGLFEGDAETVTDSKIDRRADSAGASEGQAAVQGKAGKHAALPQKAAAAGFLMPSVLTGVVIALVVAQYQPLVFNPDAYAQPDQAIAAEIKPVEVTAERQDAQPTTDVNYSAADYGIDATNLKDGTYTGSGQGYKSVITVAVTISGGKITAIEIVSAGDDEPYFSNAKGLISSVIAAQSTSVDTISGATYSSKGILVAIKNALEKAAGGTGSDTGASSVSAPAANSNKTHVTLKPTQAPAGGYADGVYYGEGEGYKSTIRVAVTVAGGKISQVEIVSQDDDAAYFNRAKALVASVVAKQSTAVDTVSGATFSSEGILAAIEDALSQAAAAAGNTNGSNAGSGSADKPGSGSNASNNGNAGNAGESGGTASGGKPSDEPAGGNDKVQYLDGSYTVYVKCENTEEPDAFEPYYLAMTVVVKDGKTTEIKDVHGTNKAGDEDAVLEEYDEANDAYLEWAAFGRTIRGKEYVGVVKQLIDLQTTPSKVDVVTRSTYSSKAIVKAYEKALDLAKDAYEKANPSDKPQDGAAADGATGSAGESGSAGSSSPAAGDAAAAEGEGTRA